MMTSSCIDVKTEKLSVTKPVHELPALNSTAFFISISFLIIFFSNLNIYSQSFQSPPTPYASKSSIFRQEIARLEITVQRAGKQAISLTQVPRVQKGDILKVKMLDEPVGGIRPSDSMWDWTLLIAYINPNRNDDKQKSVSEEIRFKEKGWYREYFFTVPYDSQPVVFLYPKPQYRDKILNLINKNYDDIRKLGEKTIEIAGAYAQISTFLNELQGVLRDPRYSRLYNPTPTPYYSYPYGYNNSNNQSDLLWMDQAVEGLAKSFNIQLPSCWRAPTSPTSGSYTTPGSMQDFVGRTQCVAKNVRLEDLDISITKMWQQGGVFLAAQLAEKYPQIAYWINIAAAAIDFIVKAFGKTALRIVPTVVSSQEMQFNGYSYQPVNPSNTYNNPGYSTNFSPGVPTTSNVSSLGKLTKISVFAETPPNDNAFVTAFPVVLHKWQAEPDPEIIELPTPILLEPCLHTGLNILKNTDLSEEWVNDTFTRDFKLVVNSSNGFRKEFFLRKNVGMGGWELNLTPQDFTAFPKVNMTLEAEVFGTRGFNEIKSKKFDLPVAVGGTWSISPESQKAFAVGGKRKVILQNSLGTCRCLQAVIYKPSFGGQFVFEANGRENGLQFSGDGREAFFVIDAGYFQPGQGTLELRAFGSDIVNIPIKLYPKPPVVTDVKIAKGDSQAILTGERLEQIQWIKINGKRAKLQLAGIPTTPPVNTNTSNGIQSQKLTQRVFVFEDPKAIHTADTISLELGLENERNYPYPETFAPSPSRPAVAANDAKEIEGAAATTAGNTNNTNNKTNQGLYSLLNSNKLPVFPIETSEITVSLQNTRTDYDFKAEDLSIETRIEKSQKPAGDLIKVNFEVLNWKNMKVTFTLTEQIQKLIGGRRLQFRIKDSERGDSDWYTIKQPFVRFPNIVSVKCTTEMNGQCEIKGEGIDYIGQVSVDGGKSWFPSEANGLKTQATKDGQTAAMIPLLTNKKLLQIKLMDFPKTEGLSIVNYLFSNTARIIKKPIEVDNQNIPANPNQPITKPTP
jgi:hypothetical protein